MVLIFAMRVSPLQAAHDAGAHSRLRRTRLRPPPAYALVLFTILWRATPVNVAHNRQSEDLVVVDRAGGKEHAEGSAVRSCV